MAPPPNDALLSGSVDIIAGGVAPFVRLWDKTDGSVKSLGTLDRSPLLLNSNNSNVSGGSKTSLK